MRFICQDTHGSDLLILPAVEYSRTCHLSHTHSPEGGHLSCLTGLRCIRNILFPKLGRGHAEIQSVVSFLLCLKHLSSSRTPTNFAKLPGLALQFKGRWDFWERMQHIHMKGLSRVGRLQVSAQQPPCPTEGTGPQRLCLPWASRGPAALMDPQLTGLWLPDNPGYLRSCPDLEAPGPGPYAAPDPLLEPRGSLRGEKLQGKGFSP